MDNILKLLLGVLTISGLIALLVPSGTPVQPPANVVSPSIAAPPPLPSISDDVSEDYSDSDIESDYEESGDEDVSEDDFIIGEPSIDGKPFDDGLDPPSGNPDAGPSQANNGLQSDPSPPNSDVILQ